MSSGWRCCSVDHVFDDLKALIDYIETVYTSITDVWNASSDSKVNLKKTYVSDISSDSAIYAAISEYVRLLNAYSAEVSLQLSSVCNCQVTARVKAQNSIEFKIYNYKSARHGYGKVPISKCFNDLFGIRIILSPAQSFSEIMSFVERTYSGKYKCIDSSKNDYRAVHLYFKKDNQSFQWELQIWNDLDKDRNFISHKQYKQEYTSWEKEAKEGGIING